MYTAGRTQMMDRYSVVDAISRMKELGFRGAEISLLNSSFQIRTDLLDETPLKRVFERLNGVGLTAGSLSLHGNFVYDDYVFEQVKRAIPMTPCIGTDTFVIAGTRYDKTGNRREQWQRMVERTSELCVVAEASGVRIAEEAEPGFICGNARELLNLIDEVGSEALGCNMDIGHAFLCDPDPFASIRALGDRVFHCHFEDMKRGVHNHLLPGDGDMDLPAYVETLREIGYEGPLALDLYGYDYEAVAPGVISYLDGLLN